MNLEKYSSKNYNFTLQNKHINAKNNLEKIKFKLLNQIGGAVPGADSNSDEKNFKLIINKKKQDEFIKELENAEEKIDYFLDKINQEAKEVGIDVKNNKFYVALIEADSLLNSEINNYLTTKINIEDKIKINLLKDIQLGLLKLQVKVILQKFKEFENNIPQIDLTNLLKAVKVKINSINDFVDYRVDNYNDILFNNDTTAGTGTGTFAGTIVGPSTSTSTGTIIPGISKASENDKKIAEQRAAEKRAAEKRAAEQRTA